MTTEPKPGAFPPRVRFYDNNEDGFDYEILGLDAEDFDVNGPDVDGEYLSLAEHLHLTSALEEGVRELQNALIKMDAIIAVAYVKN